jgi:hypothetical protein
MDNCHVRGGKRSLKYINMGFSFKSLITTSPTMKIDFQSDKQFKLQIFLNIQISALNVDDVSCFDFGHPSPSRVNAISWVQSRLSGFNPTARD